MMDDENEITDAELLALFKNALPEHWSRQFPDEAVGAIEHERRGEFIAALRAVYEAGYRAGAEDSL